MKNKNNVQGSTIIEYIVVLVFGMIVVWRVADSVMDNLVEHQDEYVHSMAQPTTSFHIKTRR